MRLLCILMLLIMPASALSASISMSDGASSYTETLTANMETGDSLSSHTMLSLVGGQMGSFTTLDAEGNGSVEVDRTLVSSVSVESSISETGGKIHAELGMVSGGQGTQWMDNATIRDADKAEFSLHADKLDAFVALKHGSMNLNSMVKVTPGWNAWGIHSPDDIKTKVGFNVSL